MPMLLACASCARGMLCAGSRAAAMASVAPECVRKVEQPQKMFQSTHQATRLGVQCASVGVAVRAGAAAEWVWLWLQLHLY